MFGVLTSLVQTATEQAKKLTDEGLEFVKQTGVLDLEEGYNDEEKSTGLDNKEVTETTQETSSEVKSEEKEKTKEKERKKQDETCCVTKQLLTIPPSEWESPVEEWQMIAESVLMEENTCIIPPSRIIENKEIASKICKCLKINSIANLPTPAEVDACKPSKEVVEWILSSSEKMEFRSSLVPRLVGDEDYWVNLSWRFHLYHMCRNTDQLLDLVEIVSTEPDPVDKTGTQRKKNIGVPNNTEYWKKLRDEVQSKRALKHWIQEQVNNVNHEIELACGNLQLLSKLIKKRETTDLGNSVCESCKYHKTKLSRLMGDLAAEQEKLNDSELSVEHGSLFSRLVETNEMLRIKIEAYTDLCSGNLSEGWEHLSDEGNVEVATKNDMDEEKETDGDVVFEAALPWEDEEEKNANSS
ncbi:uncharacterized protein TM35_000072030 [Trypanosoma theileri]|uniref:Uncharacterized protein n=1 Tax=Trypanosoma theileri TaxID=67003 RepID=A0A1X0P2L0_9TRYP|nr:uncharacterized protein TM35_000072030 [Trypanosoma theileri]ORC90779.1 hypothetical protein TM35_000072030 [Trypanosoma theileri]